MEAKQIKNPCRMLKKVIAAGATEGGLPPAAIFARERR